MRVQLTPARPDSTERGAVAIIVALTATLLIGVAAFVTDFGMAYAGQRALQNGADAAALAAGRTIAAASLPSDTCSSLETKYGISGAEYATIRGTADSYFKANTFSGAALPSGDDGLKVDCETVAGKEHLVVTVSGNQDSQTFFGGLYGVNRLAISKYAKVIVGPVGTVVGLRPFALCDADATLLTTPVGTLRTFDFDNADAGCGYAPGNWGTLDLNGGSNSTPELADWIENGYNGPISNATPLIIPGEPGAPPPGGIEAEMNFMTAQPSVVFPVFDSLTVNGQNAQYRITGFISVKVCGWKLNNKSGNDVSCFQAPSPEPVNYIQLKFIQAIPIGQLNLQCTLGPSLCDKGTRVAQLAD
jgi:Flp pilus assembly protein TadG